MKQTILDKLVLYIDLDLNTNEWRFKTVEYFEFPLEYLR